MDPVFFLVLVLIGVPLLAPIFGAESRPDFLRVDRKHRPKTVGPMRPSEWDV